MSNLVAVADAVAVAAPLPLLFLFLSCLLLLVLLLRLRIWMLLPLLLLLLLWLFFAIMLMGVVRFEFRTGRDGIAVRVRVAAVVRGGTGTARRVDAEDDFAILTGVLSLSFV